MNHIERFAELEKYGIKYEPSAIKEADNMTCILGEEYIQKGFDRGISQGITQGIALGAEQNLVDNIRQIMNKLNYTLAQAMDLFNVEKGQQADIIELVKKSSQE